MSIESKNVTESPNSIRNIRKRQLIELLKADPTLTRRDLADKLNISTVSVSNYLRILSSENALGEYPQLSQKRRERKSPKLVKPSKIENVVDERLLSKIIRKLKYDKLVKLVNSDPSLTNKDLAKKLNVSTASVSNYLRRLSDNNTLCKSQRASGKHIELKCRDLAELINKDPTLTNDDLARMLNVSTKTISKYLHRLSAENSLIERQSSNTKKCEHKRVKLVELLNANPTLTNKELAEKLDISTSALSQYLRTLSDENVSITRHTLGRKRSEDKIINKERVAELIKQDPTLTYKAISKLIGVSFVTVRNYILELERDSLQVK